jgi:NADH:ubiquinone reductase (H+-translocating)
MKVNRKKRIIILGGGFGGVYTAMHLEKLFKNEKNWEICLINKENYFVYQPMLAEVVGGAVDLLDTVSSIRRLLPKTKLYVREIEKIDTDNKKIVLAPKFSHREEEIPYDHLVIALGNVTDFRGMAGLHEHALPFKTLADAVVIRNRVIDAVEAAAQETDEELKRAMLTFVVGGGGYSGVEVAAEINDFLHDLVRSYPIDPRLPRVVLIHSKERLLFRELSPKLGEYSGKLLKKRGMEIRFNCRLATATPYEAVLKDGERIPALTVISTVPSSPNPLLNDLHLEQEKGKIKADLTLQADGTTDYWALGDCAMIPSPEGKGVCPPTAQFAIRQGKVCAENIYATVKGLPKKNFNFSALGSLGALGHKRAVAEILGFKFSGVIAWLLWRFIYWMKLPGADRKLKVLLTWMLDSVIPIEPVQLKIAPTSGIARLHFEAGEDIFREGDVGDFLYIMVKGEVDILKTKDGEFEKIATLHQGEYFGEMALLNEKKRNATIRCNSPVDVLALKKSDFGALIANFSDLRSNFEDTEKQRKKAS